MCKPLNRKGTVCSECTCMNGYGPAVMSVGYADIQCVNCSGTWYGVPLFLFLEFFPITVFYFIIQINITSGSITCYIMYSQLFIIAYDHIIAGDNFEITDILLTSCLQLVQIPNFFLRFCSQCMTFGTFVSFATSFCISSSMKPIRLVFLSYISVFYPLCLMAVTWVCIELYDRNFRQLRCNFRPLRCL